MSLNLKLSYVKTILGRMFRQLAPAKANQGNLEVRGGVDPGIPRVMAISKDDKFLNLLRELSTDSTWYFTETDSVGEALNILRSEYFPVVVLDQDACEQSWESCVSALVRLRRIPCVICASQYGDEYARLEIIRLGGYDVLNKSASKELISQSIEFAWFWSQYSSPQPEPMTNPERGATT